MADGAEVMVERVIAASPDELWAHVSDIGRMGELSPENVGNTWLKGATGPAVGARFKGDNRNGKKKWSTVAKVVECEPGRVFAFECTAGPLKISRWTYRFNAVEGGTRVTETWLDQRGAVVKALGKPLSGVADRNAHNRETMQATLETLAARYATAD